MTLAMAGGSLMMALIAFLKLLLARRASVWQTGRYLLFVICDYPQTMLFPVALPTPGLSPTIGLSSMALGLGVRSAHGRHHTFHCAMAGTLLPKIEPDAYTYT